MKDRDEATGLGEHRMADDGNQNDPMPQGDGDPGTAPDTGSAPVGDPPADDKKSDE